MMPRAACCLLLLAACGAARAQIPIPARSAVVPPPADVWRASTEIEAGGTHENLTGGNTDWRSIYLHGVHRSDAQHTFVGTVRETERFGLRDNEASVGAYFPLGGAWQGLVEATASGTYRVLPKYSLFGQVFRSLGGGWGVNAGLRHSEYASSGANLLVAGVERYFGNYRAGYTFYSGRPEGAASGPAHRVQVDYYYAERSMIGLSLTRGREVENVGPPTGIVSSDVRDVTLTGRHWLSQDWALTYDLLSHQQGTFYRRDGVRLGLRYRF